MADWLSYSLSDFLLFSPQVYERLFVLLNKDLWPWQLVSLAAGIVVLALLLRGARLSARTAFVILGAGWIVVAAVFFLGRYQAINWAGAYIAPLAALQGAGLILLALTGRLDLIDRRAGTFAWVAGFAVLALGLFFYPLVTPAFGFSIEGAQVFALTPDPTAVATLGAMALLKGRVRFLAAVIPAVWCIFSGLTLWTLGRPDAFIAPGLMALAFLAAASPRAAELR